MRERRLIDNVNVEARLTAELPAVQSNDKQLDIVFINLIKNGAESLESVRNAKVIIHARENTDSVDISVQDNGPGIPAKDLGRLFEPYFTTKGRKGMGMGLYLVQQIIRAHGGSIEVISQSGQGTEFLVRLTKHI